MVEETSIRITIDLARAEREVREVEKKGAESRKRVARQREREARKPRPIPGIKAVPRAAAAKPGRAPVFARIGRLLTVGALIGLATDLATSAVLPLVQAAIDAALKETGEFFKSVTIGFDGKIDKVFTGARKASEAAVSDLREELIDLTTTVTALFATYSQGKQLASALGLTGRIPDIDELAVLGLTIFKANHIDQAFRAKLRSDQKVAFFKTFIDWGMRASGIRRGN